MSDCLLGENLVNGFIERELALFVASFEAEPVSSIQDTRALAIEWVTFYFTEYISEGNRASIVGFLREVMTDERYSTFGWYRVPALLGAAFAFTRNHFYLNHLLGNLDHHSSELRRGILEAASIICPLIRFDEVKLRETTEKNLESHHFFWEQHVLLTLSADGRQDVKRAWLDGLRSRFPAEMDKFEKELLGVDRYFLDSYFPNLLSGIQKYLLFKLLVNPSLPLESAIQPSLIDTGLTFDGLWKLAESHPLGSTLIELNEFYE